MWYTDWSQAGGREAHANMEETDGQRLPWQLTLKKGAPGDQVWDLLCVQLASYLERGPLMWMMPLHMHVNQKSDYDYDVDCDIKHQNKETILLFPWKRQLLSSADQQNVALDLDPNCWHWLCSWKKFLKKRLILKKSSVDDNETWKITQPAKCLGDRVTQCQVNTPQSSR